MSEDSATIHVNTHPLPLSPIENLPTELLIECFVHCSSNNAHAPLDLARVSRLWREVVNSSPRVWQLIPLDDKFGSVSYSRARAELWMKQSKPLPFDVELDVENLDLILPLLSPFLPAVSRWRHLTITGKREESTIVCPPSLALEPLDRLIIIIYEPDQELEDPTVNPKATFAQQWDSFVMNVWLSALPKPDTLLPLRFTRLTISDCSQGTHTQPGPIIDFLNACPELEEFSYTGWTREDRPLIKPLPVVTVPRLRKLTLRCTCSTRTILSSIHAPKLVELTLAHLNVDFRMQDPPHEDGDSDDEADDFSQSPSSDRATGMGLRKLIDRSNPPLRVLTMDYSDMRTKDFRFVFDRLRTLEHFLITASDMSDNVIDLLRPLRDMPDETRQIRLPRLQKLELYNCQQLSGDAVVDAISARVDVTDYSAWYLTLKDVAIVACDGFTDQHAQILSKELGTRFRQL